MTAVFSHGRLRLYLLRLLDDGPKHGYELIRLLEERFLGLYAPSAGTIYPRLQRLEADGLVTHTAAGGRKVYEITGAGRAELRQRAGELTALESDIAASVEDLSALAGEIQNEVRGSVRDLKRELRDAARQTRRTRWAPPGFGPTPAPAPGPSPSPAWGPGPAPGPAPAPGPSSANGPSSAAAGATALDEFDQRLAAFAVEVGALVRARGLSDSQLRTAIRLLDGALDGLRRLLR
ncbi:PadR family transcriptional regulator [Micromonospora sp. CPCC 205561]|uniref:PadR family transcriptional regulator n=1 Tax=Micromonospora sp. CPCC 205561 TaxID=3122407 RepID=UPI002FF42771